MVQWRESTRLPPTWPGFDSWTRHQMWVEFVVCSRPYSERFLLSYFGFPLSSKPNISKFQFDLESVNQTAKRIWSSHHGIMDYTNSQIYFSLESEWKLISHLVAWQDTAHLYFTTHRLSGFYWKVSERNTIKSQRPVNRNHSFHSFNTRRHEDNHPSRPKLSLGKRTFRYSGVILFDSLPETYKRAAPLEAFKWLMMKHDFA